MDGQVVGYIWEEGKSGAKTILIAIPGCRDSRGRHPQVGDHVAITLERPGSDEAPAVVPRDGADIDAVERSASYWNTKAVEAASRVAELAWELRAVLDTADEHPPKNALESNVQRKWMMESIRALLAPAPVPQTANEPHLADEESDEEWLSGIFARHPEVKEDLTAALRNALSKKHPDLMAAIDAKDWDRVRELARPLKLEEEKCQPDEAGAQLRKILIEENCRDEHGQEVEARLVYVLSAIRKLADPPPVADPDPAKTTEPRWGWCIEGVTIPPCADTEKEEGQEGCSP